MSISWPSADLLTMATLSRSTTILRKTCILPVLNRNYHSLKLNHQLKNVLKSTCACVISGSVVLYLANKYGNYCTVYALKVKVSVIML